MKFLAQFNWPSLTDIALSQISLSLVNKVLHLMSGCVIILSIDSEKLLTFMAAGACFRLKLKNIGPDKFLKIFHVAP